MAQGAICVLMGTLHRTMMVQCSRPEGGMARSFSYIHGKWRAMKLGIAYRPHASKESRISGAACSNCGRPLMANSKLPLPQ